MIEDTILTQFIVDPIDPSKIVSAEDGERAYALRSVSHGSCKDREEGRAKLEAAKSSPNTLGYELDCKCDMYPCSLDTFTADKKLNAHFGWGGHAPEEEKYQEPCRFRPGDKVLCLVYGGYDAIIPAIIVGPIDKQFVSEWYEDDLNKAMYASAEQFLAEGVSDWSWDEVIVRPLVRLKNDWEEMGELDSVQRVYIFSYKKYEV